MPDGRVDPAVASVGALAGARLELAGADIGSAVLCVEVGGTGVGDGAVLVAVPGTLLLPFETEGVLGSVATFFAPVPGVFGAAVAGPLVEAVRTLLFGIVTGDGTLGTASATTVSTVFFLGDLAGAAGLLLVLRLFFGTLTRSSLAAAVFFARGFAVVVACRRLCCGKEANLNIEAAVMLVCRELAHLANLGEYMALDSWQSSVVVRKEENVEGELLARGANPGNAVWL